jgi:hypothetical protein
MLTATTHCSESDLGDLLTYETTITCVMYLAQGLIFVVQKWSNS